MFLTCAAFVHHCLNAPRHSGPEHDVSRALCLHLSMPMCPVASRNYDIFSFEEYSINFAQFISVIPKLPYALWTVFSFTRPPSLDHFSQQCELFILPCLNTDLIQSVVIHHYAAEYGVHLYIHPLTEIRVVVSE